MNKDEDFLLGLGEKDQILSILVRACNKVCIDAFTYSYYTLVHFAFARHEYLSEVDPKLCKYGLMWDFAYILSHHSQLCDHSQIDIFEAICKFFKLEPLPASRLTSILKFSNKFPNITYFHLTYLESAQQLLGSFNLAPISALPIFRDCIYDT